LVDELKGYVAKKIGPIARRDEILFAAELRKTRSGKIMRRVLASISNRDVGDVMTLANPECLAFKLGAGRNMRMTAPKLARKFIHSEIYG
jgi:hypothetical protein